MPKRSAKNLSVLFSVFIAILLLVSLFRTQFSAYSLATFPQDLAVTTTVKSITAQSGTPFDDFESHNWIGESDWGDEITINWMEFTGRHALQAVINNTEMIADYAIMRTDAFPIENWEGWQGLKADIYQTGGANGVDVKLEVRGPEFDPPDDIELIYCNDTIIQSGWRTCTWYFKIATPTADYSEVSHLSIVFDHLSNQSPTFYIDNVRLFDSGTEEVWDNMDDGTRNWFYFGNWYNWLAITPTFGWDQISHNGNNPTSPAGALYLAWDYSNGQDPRHPKAEIGTKHLTDIPDWSNYNRVVADVKVSDINAPISLFFWDEETKSGHNTSSKYVENANNWQTLIWDIYWPPGFDNTNLDEFKFVIGDIDKYPIGDVYFDNIRLFSLDCIVGHASDSGFNSLRDCIETAQPNDYIGFDPIAFPSNSPTTISLSSELPTIITDGLTIDGTGANVILDGSLLLVSSDGFPISGADSVTIRDLTITNFPGNGVKLANGTQNTIIGPNNTISLNELNGILIDGSSTDNNTITANSIYGNLAKGISHTNGGNNGVSVPTITGSSERTVKGTGSSNVIIEVFSDDGSQGEIFEGSAISDSDGNWAFHKNVDFHGPNLKATATNIPGSTSEFSPPVSITNLPAWTIMIYLNGDNDLEHYTFEAFNKLEVAAFNPNIEILVLWDRSGADDTNLYLVQPDSDLLHLATYTQDNHWDKGEMDMGSPVTLSDFVSEVRIGYPAEHYLLSIVDHGGGWSPKLPPDLARRRWVLGGSGLSWDQTSNFSYLSTYDMKNVFDQMGSQGGPIDIVFYDACLMGMFEEAYQIRENANYLIASENESWASFAYDAYLKDINQTTTPKDLAIHIVDEYHDSLDGYPRTMSAIDLSRMDELAVELDKLALSLIQSYPGAKTVVMTDTFTITQKYDYDYDLILSEKDGYVDLYDFASNLNTQMPGTSVATAAQSLLDVLDDSQNPVIVHEKHASNVMWVNNEYIELDNSHGLSIYLPFGENDNHMQYYLDSQLELAADTLWNDFIFKYLNYIPLNQLPEQPGRPNPTPSFIIPTVYLPIVVR